MWWETDPGEKGADGKEAKKSPPIIPQLFPSDSIPSTTQQIVPVIVPDVINLKEQLQQQQTMLTQIKETLKANESQLSSKEKQAEVNIMIMDYICSYF